MLLVVQAELRLLVQLCVGVAIWVLPFFVPKGGEEMKVVQVLNNNVALVKRGGNEVIVYARGVAFSKRKGDSIGLDEIQRVFVLDSHDKLEHFSYLLSHVGDEYLGVVTSIIEYAEQKLGERSSDYMYLVLLDHVSFMVERLRRGETLRSPLQWEVRRYYPVQYEVGRHAIELVERTFDVDCPEDEAVSFALHFINQQMPGKSTDELIIAMQVVKDVLNIIQRHFGMVLEDDSVSYARLVTHVQFFATRLVTGARSNSAIDSLHDQVCSMYPDAYECVKKISLYVEGRFGVSLSGDEETYLVLHIQRVAQRAK